MNAIEHGGHLDPEKNVDMSYIRTARTIVYYIRDPGEGFSMNESRPRRHRQYAGGSVPAR